MASGGREGAGDEAGHRRGDRERSERDRRRERRLRERGEEEAAPEKSRTDASGKNEVALSQEAAQTSDHRGRGVKDVGGTEEPVGPLIGFPSMGLAPVWSFPVF